MSMSTQLAAEYKYQLAHAYQHRGPNLLAAGIVTLAFAYLAVGIRLFSRRYGKIDIGKDDIFIAIALFWASAYTIPILVTIRYGFGRHSLLLNEDDRDLLGKAFLGILAVLPVAIGFTKISILLLFNRIFTFGYLRTVLILTGIFIICTEVANLFSQIFECIPVGSQLSDQPHHCINQDAAFTTFSFINMVIDWWVLLIPVPAVWNLHASFRRKVQISAVFMLGTVACIASTVRAAESLTTDEIDTTYDDATSQVWTMVEINLSIVSSCLLTFRPFFKFVKEKRDQYSLRYLNTRTTSRKTSASSDVPQRPSTTSKKPENIELGEVTHQESSTF